MPDAANLPRVNLSLGGVGRGRGDNWNEAFFDFVHLPLEHVGKKRYRVNETDDAYTMLSSRFGESFLRKANPNLLVEGRTTV